MDKELCFCIEGNKLYLEQVLVDYNDIPIFFVCKDNVAYYVVLCSDIEELSYIVVNLSDIDLYNLLHGMLSMREVFTKQKNYWEIISGEKIESDIVICKSMEEIDYSVLPEEGACFEILTDRVSSYVKKFDDIFLSEERFKVLLQKPNFNEIIFNEIYEYSLGLVEKFVELYEGQLKQIITVDFQDKNIDYEESMYNVLKPNTTISEKEHSEEWESIEMEILAYAA